MFHTTVIKNNRHIKNMEVEASSATFMKFGAMTSKKQNNIGRKKTSGPFSIEHSFFVWLL